MKSPATLESVSLEFLHWRASRTSMNAPVPDSLRAQAIKLLVDNKKTDVINALKINHSSLKKWQGNNQIDHSTFVALDDNTRDSQLTTHSADISAAAIFSGLKVTLHNPNGTEMSITGEMTLTQLQGITNAFIGSQGETL